LFEERRPARKEQEQQNKMSNDMRSLPDPNIMKHSFFGQELRRLGDDFFGTRNKVLERSRPLKPLDCA